MVKILSTYFSKRSLAFMSNILSIFADRLTINHCARAIIQLLKVFVSQLLLRFLQTAIY
jgi:hypothetical protein